MKIIIIFIIANLLAVQLSTAQVLFSENFDNLAVGEVSTDPTGVTPGKGGWYVKKSLPPYTFPVEIVPETGRGNVLVIGSNINSTNGLGNTATLTQKNINTLWNSRTVGNNVFKLEYDVYIVDSSQILNQQVLLSNLTNKGTANINISNYRSGYNGNLPSATKAYLFASYFDTISKILFLGKNNTAEYDNFPYNTWLSLEFFIDYKYEAGSVTGGEIYIYIPKLNILKIADFTHNEIIELLGLHGGARAALQVAVKYDNIKLTALNTLPAYLGVEDFISQKFNLFPNPATNEVTITNSENMLVQQVVIYDVSGKLITAQNFNEQLEIQLNLENLASGTYMLHLQTAQGTAVKKLVKK